MNSASDCRQPMQLEEEKIKEEEEEEEVESVCSNQCSEMHFLATSSPGSRTFSSIGGEVEGRFVTPRIAPDYEQVTAAIEVLTDMIDEDLIDGPTLRKLIDEVGSGNVALIVLLNSTRRTLAQKFDTLKACEYI